MKTIFALSSAPGKSGVAVFRISGPGSLPALLQLLLENDCAQIPQREMHLRKIYDPASHELIDNAMVVYFKAPASFTGEDVVEIHTHGSSAIAKLLTRALLSIEDLRPAEAGEFARTAFLNGKFDLTAAEGLADLIEAETIMQHRQALAQSGGQLELLYDSWRAKLVTVISLLEAYIDFPDEEIPASVLLLVRTNVSELQDTIAHYLNDNRRGERLRGGITLSILGAPNVGKSTLMNFLLQREAAIVSDIAGTTRDIIEGHLDIGGYPIILQDTAGIRSGSSDEIEQEGIKRSFAAAERADIKIIMFDNSAVSVDYHTNLTSLIDDNSILVINKIDLELDKAPPLKGGSLLRSKSGGFYCNFKENPPQSPFIRGRLSKRAPLQISLKAHIGLDQLLQEIENKASQLGKISETPAITRERHRASLIEASKALTRFDLDADLVLAAEDIRMAIRSLSSITGKITVEEILGEIFANFCIGK